MNNFAKVLKSSKYVLFLYAAIDCKFFAAFLWRNLKIKFWLTSMKTLTNCENPSSKLLVAAYRNPPIQTVLSFKAFKKIIHLLTVSL